ncbi:MAG: energy transducer TonB [Opitutaceae bacterium]|nr:energy transducer TonB [Opitutaceae bacterium]
MHLLRLPLLLTLIAGTVAASHAADKPRLASLAELDRPPERLQTAAVAVPAALAASGTADTVAMVAIVGPDGRVERVEQVKSATPAGAAAATEAVKKWIFSRAFVKGEPVAFSLPVTIAIRPRQATDAVADAVERVGQWGGETLAAAEPRFERIPEYPAALRESPVDGYALASVLVDEQGKAGDVVIEFASRAEFAESAAAVLPTWIFAAARRGGQPVATRTTVTVEFQARSATWSEPERDLHSRLRYLRDYDEGPREKATQPVVFPFEALMADKGGGVMLNVVIGPDGRVAHLIPDPGADPDYLGAARASLACWEFFPALRAGEPVYGQIKMQLTFDPRREEFAYDDTTFALIAGLKDGSAQVFSLKQVDQHPRPTSQAMPRFPTDHEGPRSGEALIECLIDTQGRPQLPRVIRASSPEFGWVAATAVAQWRFEPARKGGEAVISRARLPIRITPDTPAPGAAP